MLTEFKFSFYNIKLYNLGITGNALLNLNDVLPLSENGNDDENEANLESRQTQETQRYIPLNLSGIYVMN